MPRHRLRRQHSSLPMDYPIETLKAAHRHCGRHRAEIERSEVCGCCYCRRTYPPTEIVRWIDRGEGTALCPHCGIDSVIGSASPYPVSDAAFLAAMHARWFSVGRAWKD
jgi:hypothetical protein